MVGNRKPPIGELFAKHQNELRSFLARKVGATEADDLVQETYSRLMRRGDESSITSPFQFLRKIAANLARDHVRRKSFETKWLSFSSAEIDAAADEETPLQRLERLERAQLFRAAVAELPPRCQEVFALCFYEKMPISEIARRLGISDSMARRHLRMALKRCREAIK